MNTPATESLENAFAPIAPDPSGQHGLSLAIPEGISREQVARRKKALLAVGFSSQERSFELQAEEIALTAELEQHGLAVRRAVKEAQRNPQSVPAAQALPEELV